MYRKNFAANIPLGECNTTWGLFRLPERNMQAILSSYGSTHYRATCNFNAEVGIGLDNRRDYVRFAKCRHATALTSGHTSTCTSIVDYINVRGHACRQCRVPFTGGSSQHIHIDLTRASTFCTTQSHFAVPDRITNEDVFGNYLNPNPLFSCAANENSTTNWWIGGVYLE